MEGKLKRLFLNQSKAKFPTVEVLTHSLTPHDTIISPPPSLAPSSVKDHLNRH
jgi:hypothetical protein